jgi:hypothetical protein
LKGLPPSEATWEFIKDFSLSFHEFSLKDKGAIRGGKLLQASLSKGMTSEKGIRVEEKMIKADRNFQFNIRCKRRKKMIELKFVND